LSPRGNCSFVYEYCCVGRLVYGTTSLLPLQKRSLTAEIVGFFTVIQKAPAASNLSFPSAKLLIAGSCPGFNVARPSFSLPYVITASITSLVGFACILLNRLLKQHSRHRSALPPVKSPDHTSPHKTLEVIRTGVVWVWE